MKKRFIDYIYKYDLIRQNDKVCAGVSGGADSVCLLILLNEIRDEIGFALCAFHVDHNLRGDESKGDREFTEKLCREMNIPLEVFSYDVNALSAEWKKGTEETGRICRREAARKMLDRGCTSIALAHHMNDQAETLLFNLARGSSLPGLSGIRPRQGVFIRPLLGFSRAEIEEFLKTKNVSWRTDSSNYDTGYTRNKIRHEIIPLLEGINKNAVGHMCESASDIALADEMFSSLSGAKLALYTEFTENGFYILPGILEEPYLLGSYIVRDSLKKLLGSSTDIGRMHTQSILSLFDNQSGREVCLPFGLKAARIYERIFVSKDEEGNVCSSEVFPLVADSVINTSHYRINVGRAEANPGSNVFLNLRYTKTFDYDTIKNACFRCPRKGDRIQTIADGGSRKLSDYFKDIKIPLNERDKMCVMADGNNVFWVIGERISEDAKVTERTGRIITIEAEKL